MRGTIAKRLRRTAEIITAGKDKSFTKQVYKKLKYEYKKKLYE